MVNFYKIFNKLSGFLTLLKLILRGKQKIHAWLLSKVPGYWEKGILGPVKDETKISRGKNTGSRAMRSIFIRAVPVRTYILGRQGRAASCQ